MPKAIWNNVVIAESDATVVVEGNHYFPPASLNESALTKSDKTTVCGWKGTANYYHVHAGDDVNQDAAWYYAEPKSRAENIRGHVAFWRGVEIVD
ncbi:MAG: DUF427 domain-containing protein [Pseudomonadota bacterium]